MKNNISQNKLNSSLNINEISQNKIKKEEKIQENSSSPSSSLPSSSLPPPPSLLLSSSPSSSSLFQHNSNSTNINNNLNNLNNNSKNNLNKELNKNKKFEKEIKQIDGISFTSKVNNTKFSFKKVIVTKQQDEISEDSSNLNINIDNDENEIEEINEGKARNFEFTNNKSLMRVFRAIIYFQMISLICDNPAVKFPPIFDVLCRAPFFYLIRFYSYPFVDAVYLIQKYGKQIIYFFTHISHYFPKSTPTINYHPPPHRNLAFER